MGTEKKPVILIVDDEEIVRRSIRHVIELECGFEPIEACDGVEAAKILKEKAIDVVLLDIRMPNLDGMELLQVIKTISADKDVIVIMVTAIGSVPAAVSAVKKGAFDYIPKPYENEILIMKVEAALEHKKLIKEVREKQEEMGINLSGERLEMQRTLEKAVHYLKECKRLNLNVKDQELGKILNHTTYDM